MRIAFVDEFKLAVVSDQKVVDVSDVVSAIPHLKPQDLLEGVIARFAQLRPKLESAAQSRPGKPIAQSRFRQPVPQPSKIVCMAGNYMESGTIPAPYDVDAFLKSPASIVGDGDTVVLPDAPATVFQHEAELGVVIGRRASKVRAARALEHVFGYVNFIDVSARGINPNGRNSFWWQKSWDTFGPIGPWVATRDDVPDPQKLQIRLWNNGDLRQDFSTSDMARGVAQVIELISNEVTLLPGDVIATGTNHLGLGPLQDGEKVEMEITGLGRLHLSVKDDKKRTWRRETVAQQRAREASEKEKAAVSKSG
ncbi:MAG: fumarylacetoacetate hydrolase family protein [Chloroflexi bacterium]|nr:fumarylacetoacetate hydrolase family protein [Chloroflexota bacterium]